MTLVVDASIVVAGLIGSGPDSRWAEARLGEGPLFAPHLLPVEVANVIRRAYLAGQVSEDVASLAHTDLVDLSVGFLPYEPFAERVWELRPNLTMYDGWYVATAEALAAPLATLDLRLARSQGPRCQFSTPPTPPGAAR